MLAAVPNWIEDVAVVAGAIVAVLTALGLLSRSRFGKYVASVVMADWTHRFAESVVDILKDQLPAMLDSNEARTKLEDIIDELRPNGGSSMRDEMRAGFAELSGRLGKVEDGQVAAADDRADLRAKMEGNAA